MKLRPLLGALCALALAGCAPSASSGKTVLRVAGWGGAGDDSEAARIEREVYAEFERRHPGVEIQKENIPGSQDYVRKLLLSFIAGAEPDIIRLDASSAAVFIDNGALMDLTPLVEGENGIDLDDYFPTLTDIAAPSLPSPSATGHGRRGRPP